MLLISACLVGIKCKYNGGHNYRPELAELVRSGRAIPFCPEQLGGASTPREAVEIQGGDGHDVLDDKARAFNKEGRDVTEIMVRGARESLQLAQMVGAKTAILKERSPSCGVIVVYDGTFGGRKIAGQGVTAALLQREGIKVYSEENCKEIL